jgi:hypothetical protein
MLDKCLEPLDSSPGPTQRERSPEEIECARDRGLDKTLADSFPSSDPPSTIPDPCADLEENEAA